MILDFFKGLVSPVANTITKINTNKTDIKKRNIDRLVNAEDKLSEWQHQANIDKTWALFEVLQTHLVQLERMKEKNT